MGQSNQKIDDVTPVAEIIRDHDARVETFAEAVLSLGTACVSCSKDYLLQTVNENRDKGPSETVQMINRITHRYAKDIFTMLAEEISNKNPWKIAAYDLSVLYKGLDVKDTDTRTRVASVFEAIKMSRQRYKDYVNEVITHNVYRDPASQGMTPEKIERADQWAQAIRTLSRVAGLLQNHTRPTMQLLESKLVTK